MSATDIDREVTHSKDPKLVAARLFVGSLPTAHVSEDDVRARFSKYGKVIGVACYKGFGFVQYEMESDARRAVSGENNVMWKGSKLDVRMAAEGRKSGSSNSTGNDRGRDSRGDSHSRDAYGHRSSGGMNHRDSGSSSIGKRSYDIGHDSRGPPDRKYGGYQDDGGYQYRGGPASGLPSYNVPPTGMPPQQQHSLGSLGGSGGGGSSGFGGMPPLGLGSSPGPTSLTGPFGQMLQGGGPLSGTDMPTYYDRRSDPMQQQQQQQQPPQQQQPQQQQQPTTAPAISAAMPANNYGQPAARDDFYRRGEPEPMVSSRPADHYGTPADRPPPFFANQDSFVRRDVPPPFAQQPIPVNRPVESSSSSSAVAAAFNEADKYGTPNRPPPAPPTSKFDCVLVVAQKQLRNYAEMVERRLIDMKMNVDMIFLVHESALQRAIDDMAKQGVPYVIVIQPQHELHRSVTVNILHGTPQEHRNMPFEDAVAMLSRNFADFLASTGRAPAGGGGGGVSGQAPQAMPPPVYSQPPSMNQQAAVAPPVAAVAPTPVADTGPSISFLLSLLSDGKQVTIGELDRVIRDLQDRRERLLREGPPALTGTNIGMAGSGRGHGRMNA